MCGSNEDNMMDGKQGIGKVYYLTGLEGRTLCAEATCVSTVGVSTANLLEVKSSATQNRMTKKPKRYCAWQLFGPLSLSAAKVNTQ